MSSSVLTTRRPTLLQDSYRGLSLVEVLVTMAVLAILVSIGIPSYQALIQRQRVDATMHLLTSHMASARLSAVNYRMITVVCPSDGHSRICRTDGDWSQGWMMFRDNDGNHQPDLPHDILRVEVPPLHPSLRLVSSRGRKQLRYLADGRASGSNLSVRLCQGPRLMAAVMVNNSGRIRSTRGEPGTGCAKASASP
ncbi:GspH/FimT family pseudopilin [Pseudoxanthomonas dokdonensis]|uniref:Type II secretion system protein H n=1 Tax=Pseudoxanthomonas dokdonensis TaxID=344882 RepID=A0A0R0CRT5_9GAMM|nr:GspH/FimT family pseudopilin [Pseudoxanthomonas dokdonensis]KRG69154.1 hypothetical protein ABB29_12195 [Pseudoxanthomonas dokdonensis]